MSHNSASVPDINRGSPQKETALIKVDKTKLGPAWKRASCVGYFYVRLIES